MTRQVKILVVAFVGALAFGGMAVAPAGAESPAPDRATARYEVDFLTGMIDHHAMAVHMSEICVEKAAHEELQSLCEQILVAQSSEVQMMQSWLQDWYGAPYEASMPPGHMQQTERMGEMDPAEFEVEFMETMVRHHRQAIREASGCVDRAHHEELVTLCENIIETQAGEIETMQGWLCEWYDRTAAARQPEPDGPMALAAPIAARLRPFGGARPVADATTLPSRTARSTGWSAGSCAPHPEVAEGARRDGVGRPPRR